MHWTDTDGCKRHAGSFHGLRIAFLKPVQWTSGCCPSPGAGLALSSHCLICSSVIAPFWVRQRRVVVFFFRQIGINFLEDSLYLLINPLSVLPLFRVVLLKRRKPRLFQAECNAVNGEGVGGTGYHLVAGFRHYIMLASRPSILSA